MQRFAATIDECTELFAKEKLPQVEPQLLALVAYSAHRPGHTVIARNMGLRAGRIAPVFGDLRAAIIAHRDHASVCLGLGDFAASETHASESLRLAELTGNQSHVHLPLAYLGLSVALQGNTTQGAGIIRTALKEHGVTRFTGILLVCSLS